MRYSIADRDTEYMQHALGFAREALAAGDVPIGAIIVDSYGEVIGNGYNMVEALRSQIEHAEVRAVRSASMERQNWRLDGCSLYVTLEPCLMCMGLLVLSRVERVVYGASSPRFGAFLDNGLETTVYTRQIKCVTSGVCADEATMLLGKTFGLARERHGF